MGFPRFGTRLTTASCAAMLVALAASAGEASATSAEPNGLDPQLSAKIAREKAKQRQMMSRNGGQGDSGQCGHVDIGNDDPDDRRASRKLNERSKTVIVTGDVINMAKCR